MLIKNLRKTGHKDTLLVGGKAASLGEMLQAGMPVPEGFVITTQAYEMGMTHELQQEISEMFDELGVIRVAVRSSAVAEDSPDASWAGQLESYLNVTKDGLIDAVTSCWQSIKSDRARSYAAEHKVNEKERAVAVVVQKMVNSEISGVMFTANPITSNQHELMIEAVYGLGEMIVQGIVTPESIIINKKTGHMISRSQHRQIKQLVCVSGKNTETAIEEDLQNNNILSSKQIKELAALARRIETHYNSPQDIEWAFADGRFYIVQSRPITTLMGHTDQARDDSPFTENADIFHWGPIRGHYFYISDYVAACHEHLYKRYNQYFPETLLLFNGEHMVWLSDQEKWTDHGKNIFIKHIEKPETLGKMKNDWQQATDKLAVLQITIIPKILHKLSDDDFIQLWQRFYDAMMDFWVPTLLPELGNYGAPDLLKQDLVRYIHDDEGLIRAQETLTAPEELSFYQQEEIQLKETANISSHQAKYFWLKNSYGHVEVLDAAFFKARQDELIASVDAPSQNKLRHTVKIAKSKLQKRLDLPDSLMRRAKLISENIVWQDHRKRCMTENFHYKKLLLDELARRTNKNFDDLLRLGFDEAIEILRNRDCAKRSACHGVKFQKSLVRLTAVQAEAYWHDYAHHKSENIDIIRGIVASTGNKSIVHGRVRVLRSSHDILKPGEILVTAMTSPGYVFAMRHASAVITDIGGLTSHAAIVAREIGVPCIVGTKIATRALQTGDKVKIDVLRGIIKFVNEEK